MKEEKAPTVCSKTCIAILLIIILALLSVIVFYEAAPTSGDLCKIYG